MTPEETEKQQFEKPLGEQVLLVPGVLFYTEHVDVPEAVAASEIGTFAELALESLSPFPVDQLYWGFLYQSGSTNLLLYAAHKDRLKREGFDHLEDYAWVLPDFATVSFTQLAENAEILYIGTHSVSLVHRTMANPVPTSLQTAPMPEDGDLNRVFESLRQQAPELPLYSTSLQVRLSEVVVEENCLPVFAHEVADSTITREADFAPWTRVEAVESALWPADIRPAAFKQRERNARRLNSFFVRATYWSIWIAVLFVLMELALFGGGKWLESKRSLIDSQLTAVARVEDQQSLMLKLDQVAQNELRPIAMLEMANQIRVDLNARIEYNSVAIEGENRITIEGKAGSVNEFYKYTEQLKRSGNFDLIDSTDSTTRGDTTFRVIMDYIHSTPPPAPDAPLEADPPESGEEVVAK
ncbi:hypothetical protein [Coraliomargarita parva]|uniref:hypothetical protein n=1 Tax=Coraliomargarita parva TaxID=3014050 RepID=UPI0022B49D09|nr:hypothetical protein [Coraliomargarita parva]